MSREIVPLSPEALEGLRAFTRDAVKKGAAPVGLARPARQQSLFPTDGLPLFTSKAPQEEEPPAPTDPEKR